MQECIITDGRDTRAAILPAKGATAVSFQYRGKEFLYCDPENLASSERPRCGIPFLFPIFGRLMDGIYQWNERTYAMDIHGFAHTSRWQVLCQKQDRLILVLESDEHTLSQYPFSFRVTLEFSIRDAILTIHQIYENTGSAPMPYNYGFHPYFRTERPEDLRVETTADTIFDFSAGPKAFGHGTVSLTMPTDAAETGAAFMGVHSPTIVHNDAEGTRLTMAFDESFHTHVLWAQSGKHFLCVEPINGTANGLNTGDHLTLSPGERKNACVSLRAEIL